jgi:hypothetical protein
MRTDQSYFIFRFLTDLILKKWEFLRGKLKKGIF